MSTKAQRNALLRALEIGPGWMTSADIRRNLERPRCLDVGDDDGVICHNDGGLDDEELLAILGELVAAGDARHRDGLWCYRDSMAPPSN